MTRAFRSDRVFEGLKDTATEQKFTIVGAMRNLLASKSAPK